MFLDWIDLRAKNLELLDLDTNEFIKNVNWIDTEIKEYEFHIWQDDVYIGRQKYKGNIVLVYKGE